MEPSVAPHKGDWTEFVTGDLQSLCEPCHKSAKRQIELRGYRCDVGIDGFPTDPNIPLCEQGDFEVAEATYRAAIARWPAAH